MTDVARTEDESKRFDFWLTAACVLYVANIVGWVAWAIWRTLRG